MTFAEIGNKYAKINIEDIVIKYLSNEKIKSGIVAILKNRLFKLGLQKNGKLVSTDKSKGKIYTERTKFLKSRGISYVDGKKISTGVLPTNRVTLVSTKTLYSSFQMKVRKAQFELLADFENSRYKKFTSLGIYYNFQKSFASKQAFYEAVMSLTDKEMKTLFNGLSKEIIKEFLVK